jgi:Asp-tRNA(Asn)/Glu-tRNA(Gln) amidotransferase C subunit
MSLCEDTAWLEYFAAMKAADEDEGAFGVPVLDLPPTTQAFSAGNRLRFDATANNSNNTNSNPLYNLANELLNRSPESENRFVVIPNVL